MKSFSTYLTEAKNTHMTHLEDLVFEGSGRVEEAISFAEEVAKMLSGQAATKVSATVKWDGAPAIFCGIHPETKKFFVGTKSVFNKTPKINYTVSDIRKNHPGGVSKSLETALKHLKKLPIRGVLQGDMMFGPGDVTVKKIKGESYYTFTPNTITYAVPVDSDFGRKIKSSKMGIVFHTKYTGNQFSNMKASFNVNVNALKNVSGVWVDDAKFRDLTGTATLTPSETETLNGHLKVAKSQLSSSGSFLDELKDNTKVVDELNIYANQQVRKGVTSLSASEFTDWISSKLQAGIDALKTDAAKARKESARDEMVTYLKAKNKQLDSVFALHASLTSAKIILVRKLESVKSIGTFIQTANGFKVTAPEGFVAIDKLTKKAVKLVDRLEFSRANFTVDKNWI